jgi:hypothetical protein
LGPDLNKYNKEKKKVSIVEAGTQTNSNSSVFVQKVDGPSGIDLMQFSRKRHCASQVNGSVAIDEEKRKFEVLSTRLELSNKLICVGFPGSESITKQTSGDDRQHGGTRKSGLDVVLVLNAELHWHPESIQGDN